MRLSSKLGQALRRVRSDVIELVYNDAALSGIPGRIRVTSPAFENESPLPTRYTADGEGLSPPLEWSGVPREAASLVLLVEDADSPTPQPLVHGIVWGLPGKDGRIEEGALSHPEREPFLRSHMGRNSFLAARYQPPRPPAGHGPHRYAFEIFALDVMPYFDAHPGRQRLLECLRSHAIDKGMIIGTYERP